MKRLTIAVVSVIFLGLAVGCSSSEPTPNKASDYASPDSASAPDEAVMQQKLDAQQSAGGRSAAPGK
ncbi:MAG: hypothetical protein KF824_13235 [Fimbriimonadaceae bacterium]|nr:MAG: hypothetical protein KF824_13235 [Fimbriimonadaceae bacterium]